MVGFTSIYAGFFHFQNFTNLVPRPFYRFFDTARWSRKKALVSFDKSCIIDVIIKKKFPSRDHNKQSKQLII